MVFSPSGNLLIKISGSELNNGAIMNESSTHGMAENKVTVKVTGISGSGDLISVMVPIHSKIDSSTVRGLLLVNYLLPEVLSSKIVDFDSAYENYRQLRVLKNPIKTIYLLTLTIITLLIIFSATWFGFHLAKTITTPIKDLTEGTREIAKGNLNFTIEVNSDDEIGTLVRSFNLMTEDLKASKDMLEDANMELQKSYYELDQRQKHIEILLKNVTAGVISFDMSGHITTVNRSAEMILGLNMNDMIGRHHNEVFMQESYSELQDIISSILVSSNEILKRYVKLEFDDRTLSLAISATALKNDEENFIGLVVVFDDMTQLERAQRAAAWREVAKRIAHEIKNPLTPIKLSAQRLRKRYLSQFTTDGSIFDECTNTIINQVNDLKLMVDEFSNFATLPSTNPKPNNLNKIIKEVLILFKGAHKKIHFEFEPDEMIPIMWIDKEHIKRVFINLIDNAVDSIKGDGSIVITTNYDHNLGIIIATVADTGCGISIKDKHKLFEPYFSTKNTGTGLGLTIVQTIISDHNGYIRIQDNFPKGTKFIIELPVKMI